MRSFRNFFKSQTVVMALVLSLPLFLTACADRPVVIQDKYENCKKPAKPKPPYTDKSVGLFVKAQDHALDKCIAVVNPSAQLPSTPPKPKEAVPPVKTKGSSTPSS